MKKIISLLGEIVKICETNNIKYWIVGGFAIDGKRGFIYRNHGDIDICIDNSSLNRSFELFFNDNYTITKQGLKYVLYKHGIKIDLFVLFKKYNYYIRKREWFEAKFPKIIANKAADATEACAAKIPIATKFKINRENRIYILSPT